MQSEDTIHINIGRIVVNLLSLEVALRLFLEEIQQRSSPLQTKPIDLYSLSTGNQVPVSQFSNYDTLGQLITKTNLEIAKQGLPDRIDTSIVDLRDALAHGHILADNPNGPFYIYKFDKPKDGMVKLAARDEMTQEWFTQQINSTSKQLYKVIEIAHKLCLDCFPDPLPYSTQT